MYRDFYKNIKTPLLNADLLSLERNMLANSRTLLAYLRTSLSFAVAGVSLIQFFQYRLIVAFGYALVPAGAAIALFGFKRYFEIRRRIYEIRERLYEEKQE